MSLLISSAVCLSALPDNPEPEAPVTLHRSDHRPLTRMSSSSLSGAAQLRYMLQWFGEFSELQREDFMPILAAARLGGAARLTQAMKALVCDDKPVSLFQCRIKLFNEWYPTWVEEEQDRLVKGVTEMDPGFAAKLQEALLNGTNGDQNGTGELHSPDPDEDEQKEDLRVEEQEVPTDASESADLNSIQDNIPLEIAAAS